MRIKICKLLNVVVAMTLAAFIVSAIPSTVFASSINIDASAIHLNNVQKADHPVHQKGAPCDDGCCVTHNHCFCAGYAIPTSQTLIIPLIINSTKIAFLNQTGEGNLTLPQLRPPKNLA